MDTQQNDQTSIKETFPAKLALCKEETKLGGYTLLVGDYSKGSPYLTIGPNHLAFCCAFLVFNLATFAVSYTTNKVEEAKAFFIVLDIFTVLLDVLWLATALINPGIAPAGFEEHGGQVCEICQSNNHIEIGIKMDRQHCPQCNICIDKHENHIKWIGCCIGKNNRIVFRILLLAIILWGLTVITIIPLTYNQ